MRLLKKSAVFCLMGIFLFSSMLLAQEAKSNKIRKGDKLNILVVGSGQPIQILQVSQYGYVLIPKIGKVSAAGKTIGTLEGELKQKYSLRYPNAKVNITIKPAIEASRNIYILGQVKTPGVHQIKTTLSVVKAIALAGGMTAKADKKRIRIIHKNNPQAGEIFNWDLYNQGSAKAPNVEPDDVVLVEARKYSYVFILGAINSPGRYVIPQAVSFLEALSMAGGFSSGGPSPDVTLLRGDTKKSIVITNIAQKLTSKEVTGLKINPGDTLVIAKSSLSSITVMGAVNGPGRYAIKGAEVDIMTALSMAGGAAQGAGTASIIKKDGSISQVDLSNLSNLKSTSELAKVQAGDTVMVNRAVAKMVYVLGRVKSPGAFTITSPIKLHQALALAGDITKWGSRNGLRIIRANGSVQVFHLGDALSSTNTSKIPTLNNGDTLFVP